MTTQQPCVSVCLPVYNGETYVREAIGSILSQSFQDFELVISDNASTDATSQICRAVARCDERVRYVRAEVNQGLARNYNRAFELARGRYLVYLGHDDIMAPDYILRCVEVLQRDSGIALCFTNSNYIDEKGKVTERVSRPNPGAAPTPSERLLHILFDGMCDAVCGVMRVDVLKQTRLHGSYADADRVLLAEIGLRGRFAKISDELFFRRMHAEQVTTRNRDLWERSLVFDPSNAGKAICPRWRQLIDLIGGIRRAPLGWAERFRCYRSLYWWCCPRRRRLLYQDLLRGLRMIGKRKSIQPGVN